MSANHKADAAWDDYVFQQQEEKIEELKRELNAANQIIRQQQLLEEENLRLTAKVAQLYEGAEEQHQRIKRLEEAGDELLRDNDDMANINRWLRAKEAKP